LDQKMPSKHRSQLDLCSTFSEGDFCRDPKKLSRGSRPLPLQAPIPEDLVRHPCVPHSAVDCGVCADQLGNRINDWGNIGPAIGAMRRLDDSRSSRFPLLESTLDHWHLVRMRPSQY
jgi:hypothetical protein